MCICIEHCEFCSNCLCTDNKRGHQELRRAAAEVARLQKKARKGENLEAKNLSVAFIRPPER